MTKEKTYDALTGYRAIAALLIVFYHSGWRKDVLGDFLYAVQENFSLGVSLFFVLSGLLITMRYSENVEYRWPWMRQYFQNRFARIFPIFFCYAFFVAYVHRDWDFSDWVLQLGLLVGFVQKNQVKIGVAWSLTTEECFYMAAPFLFLMHKKKKHFLAVCGFFSIGALLFLAQRKMGFQLDKINTTNFLEFLSRSFFGRCFEFYFGMRLAYHLQGDSSLARKGFKMTGLGLAGLLAVLCTLGLLKMNLGQDQFYVTQFLMFAFILPVPTVFFLYGMMKEKNFIQAFLGSKPLVLLGKSSYILYLIHMGPVGGIFYNKLGLGPIAGMVAIQLTSIVLYLLIEAPAQKIFKFQVVREISS